MTYSCAIDAVEALKTWQREHHDEWVAMWTASREGWAGQRYGVYLEAAIECRDALHEVASSSEREARRGANDVLLDSFQRSTEEFCACTDMSCFERVGAQALEILRPKVPLSDEQVVRFTALSGRIGTCLKKDAAS